MKFFEKYQWLFLIAAIFLGLALGQIGNIAETAAHFVVPFLMVMLFGVFLQTPFESLKKGFMNTKVVGLSLAVNFLWTPLLAFGLSFLFFRGTPDVFIALMMDLVTPCTDWYLVFTAIAGGAPCPVYRSAALEFIHAARSYACISLSFCGSRGGNPAVHFFAKFSQGFVSSLHYGGPYEKSNLFFKS